jgi:hypothetical protein
MGKNRKLKEKCSWLNDTLYTLGLDLGYKTTSSGLILLHLLSVSSHASMQHKAHPSQNGSTKMDVTVSNVGQFRSDAFTSSPVRNVSGPGPPLPSHTASNVTRTHLTTTRMIAPCGRSVTGALLLTMHTMTAPLLTMDVSQRNAWSPLGTLV